MSDAAVPGRDEPATLLPPADENAHLRKTLTWGDGVILMMAMPAALFVSLGFAMGALGVLAAALLWGVAAGLAVLHNWVYTEVASMFPQKSGGISLYAQEAWRKYTNLVGPIATFSYWFAWSSSLAVYGLLIGSLIQSEWFPDSTWTFDAGRVDVGLPHFIAIGVLFLGWVLNVFGIRPAMWVMYAATALIAIPIIAFGIVPYVTGDWDSSALGSFDIGSPAWQVTLAWLFIMTWSVFGIETSATFVPEYKNTLRDTRLALRVGAMLTLGVYILVPIGLGGVTGSASAADAPQTFYVTAFQDIAGGAGWIMVVALIGGLMLLLMQTTADAPRALYGTARDGMTVRQLGKLNRYGVPARAITLDLILNILLVLFLGSALPVIIAGNIGYLLCHAFAVSGFALLRRDRPRAMRPVRLRSIWIPIAIVLAVFDVVLVVVGAGSYEITGYGTTTDLLIGIGVLLVSLVLWAIRRMQDNVPLRFRDPVQPSEAGGPVGVTSGEDETKRAA